MFFKSIFRKEVGGSEGPVRRIWLYEAPTQVARGYITVGRRAILSILIFRLANILRKSSETQNDIFRKGKGNDLYLGFDTREVAGI